MTGRKGQPQALALPPKEFLETLLDYDPVTGVFLWKPRGGLYPTKEDSSFNGRFAWRRAGYIGPRSNRQINIDGVFYMERRLAYKMVTGKDPDGYVAAKNGDKTDARFDNLVVLTAKEKSERPITSAKARIEMLERRLRGAGIDTE